MALRRNPNQSYEQLLKTASDARKPYDKDVWLNVAFYLDQQYVEWADDISMIRHVPRRDGFQNTPRPVANKIMHFCCQEHAQALNDEPMADVLPTTDDPMDVGDALVCGAYCNWLADSQVADLDGELSDAVFWSLVGGEAFLKWPFSAKEGRGDIISCSPLDVYQDPYCKRFKNARYIIHSQFMDLEQVYDLYGKEVPPTALEQADPMRSAMLRDMGAAPVLTGARVNELWMKPNRRQPKGLYVVWAGKEQLVEPSAFPYEHGRLPFTQIGSVPRPGSGHYTCAVKYLRSGQMELNKFHAQMIMIREAFSNPKWWIPSELELEHMPDDSPRQVLTGNSQGGQLKPELIQGAPYPGSNDGQWITQEMMNTVGLHEVSQAQVPGRVEAAKAIQLLKDSDDSRLSELRRTIKLALTEGFWQQLQLARQYVKDELMVEIYSKDGLPEVKRFKGEIVKPGMRVRMSMGTGLSRNRAERADQLMFWWQQGVIHDPEIIANLLDMPFQTLSPDSAFDKRQARNENLEMAAGKPLRPHSWENHDVHLVEHNNYRKTTEFRGSSAKAQQIFEMHCEGHEALAIVQIQKLAARQAAAQAAAAQVMGQGQPPQQAGPGANGGQPNSADAVFNTPQSQAAMRDYEAHNLNRRPE